MSLKIATVDMETFFSDEYTLKKMSTTQYIRDPRFFAQTVSVMVDGWKKPKTASYKNDGVRKLLHSIDWSVTGFNAHHTHFDGLIAVEHFGIMPAFWFDTLSMSRMVFGVDASHNLDSLALRLGLKGKVHGKALTSVKGIREPDGEALANLMIYNEDDTSDTHKILHRLLPAIPERELRIINSTVRMYVEPVLELDEPMLRQVYEQEKLRRANLFEIVGAMPECQALMTGKDTPKRVLGSTEKLTALLEALGVDVPMKINPKGKMIPAFAKNDLDFQALADHDDERVRDVVDARLAVKGALIENRSERLLGYVGKPLPVYLAAYAARTLRWGGGDKVNLQNLPRRGNGAKLRHAIKAACGHRLHIADASQIEARLNSWHSGQDDITAIFAANGDVYSHAASPLYNIDVNKHDHPDERFVGKVFVLAAGYQAGARKMNHTFRSGAMGPPVNQSLEDTTYFLKRWRQANYRIVKHWSEINHAAKEAFCGQRTVEFGAIVFEGRKGHGYMHLPNETYLFYPNIWQEEGDYGYSGRNGPVKLYGGILTENTMQALGRVILADVIVAVEDNFPEVRLVTTVHDELVHHVPERVVEEFDEWMIRAMSEPPEWAAGLPLACETKISLIYDKG